MSARSSRRLPIWLPTAILATLIAAYSVYWFIVREQAMAWVEETVTTWRAAGLAVEYDALTTGGYPFRVSAQFEAPYVATGATGDGRPAIRSDILRLDMQPFDYYSLIVRTAGDVSARLPDGRAYTASAEKPLASIRYPDGVISEISVQADALSITEDGASVPLFSSDALFLSVAERSSDDETAHFGAVRVDNPRWPGADEDAAPELVRFEPKVTNAALLVAGGLGPDGPSELAWKAWRSAGGEVRLRGVIAWEGASAALTDSALTLNADGQWKGAAELVFIDPASVAQKAGALGLAAPQNAAMVGGMLGAAAGEDDTLKASLSVEDGVVRLTPLGIVLGELPPAY